MKLIFIFLVTLTLAGCATTHPGIKATSKSHPDEHLNFSINASTSLSDAHYLFLEFTIENKSTSWKEFSVSKLNLNKTKPEVLLLRSPKIFRERIVKMA